jgi:hypothetical protein
LIFKFQKVILESLNSPYFIQIEGQKFKVFMEVGDGIAGMEKVNTWVKKLLEATSNSASH